MNFLKRLFMPAPPKDRALYLYVKPKACQEIVRVRIDTMSELSRSEDNEGFFVRKLARGMRCPFQVEIEMNFDRNHNIIDKTITNGTEATEADYNAFIASKPQA
jgi:hypothetical protein